MSFIQRVKAITYNGSNASDVLAFAQASSGGSWPWQIASQTCSTLVIQNFDGGNPWQTYTLNAGDILVATYINRSVYGIKDVYNPSEFAEQFAEVA